MIQRVFLALVFFVSGSSVFADYAVSHTLNKTTFCPGETLIVTGVVQWTSSDSDPSLLNYFPSGSLLMTMIDDYSVAYQITVISRYSVPSTPGTYSVETRVVLNGQTEKKSNHTDYCYQL